jgi:hypothetical protein
MSNLRERDPLLHARFLECRVCRRVSFPVDAGWLDDELIVATYPGVCSHARTVTAVVEVRDVIIAQAFVDPELYLPGRRCAGRNRRGRRCGAYASPGSEFCADHPRPEGDGEAE